MLFFNFAKKHAKVHKKIVFYALFCFFNLTLTHFVLRVLLVDNEQAALTTYDFAVWGTLLQ